jgi:superfamily I DNA and/or RNA helicase
MSRSAKWVIVGDGNQLGAFDGENGDSKELLDEYDLEKNDLIETFFSRFEENLAIENKRFLSIQYRMNNQIGQLISDCFYDGKLESNGPENHRVLELMDLQPVTWIDTSEFPPNLREESRPHGASSIVNNAESKVIELELRKFVELIEKDSNLFSERPHVLVITPYTHQVDLLRLTLNDLSNSELITIEIQTIDSVQGREADLVFYSPVRSNIRGNVGFLNEDNFQRTNVALSRGRHMTAIVGDCSFWQDINSPLSSILRLINQGNGVVKMAHYVR